jgi:hypothetical protein
MGGKKVTRIGESHARMDETDALGESQEGHGVKKRDR